jgi:hypothetical protein
MVFPWNESYDSGWRLTHCRRCQGGLAVAATAQPIVGNLLSFVGAVAGGVLGYYTFRWIYDHGFYGMMIPGALLGLGCGILAPGRSHLRGLLCAVAAVALSLFTEWKTRPFIKDGSLDFFLKNIPSLNPMALVMIVAGAFFAYWLGKDAGIRLLPARSGPNTVRQHD